MKYNFLYINKSVNHDKMDPTHDKVFKKCFPLPQSLWQENLFLSVTFSMKRVSQTCQWTLGKYTDTNAMCTITDMAKICTFE